jgi:hypothetical protein
MHPSKTGRGETYLVMSGGEKQGGEETYLLMSAGKETYAPVKKTRRGDVPVDVRWRKTRRGRTHLLMSAGRKNKEGRDVPIDVRWRKTRRGLTIN